MPKITLEMELSDVEYARLQQLAEDETVEVYASRVGFKGVRGYLDTLSATLRSQAKDVLNEAFDRIDTQTQVAVLDQLGYTLSPTGELEEKK